MHIREIIRSLRTIAREADDIAELVIADADHRAPVIAEKHLNELKNKVDTLLDSVKSGT